MRHCTDRLIDYIERITAPQRDLWRRQLGYLISFAALSLIAYVILSNRETIMVVLSGARWQGMAPAIGLSLIAQAILPLGWYELLRRCGYSFPNLQIFRVYFITSVARYLPGGIWHFGGRLVWLRQLSVPPRVAGQTIVAEQLWVLWSALIVALFCIFVSSLEGVMRQALLGLLCLTLLIAGSLLLSWMLIDSDRYNLRAPLSVMTLPSLYSLFWVLNGISLCMAMEALGWSGSMMEWLQVIGYVPLSWAIGYLVILSPSGLGIRESVLTAFLGTLVSLPAAATIALLSRLLMVISEGAWVFVLLRVPPSVR
jgi:uncharacterized membrane protein YbhN (UPF0104 family)